MVPSSLPQDLQGTILKRRAVPGFRITENLYGPAFETPKHYHDYGIIGCVLKGSYTNTYGRFAHRVEPSTVMACPPGTLHATSSPAGAHCFNLELEPDWAQRLHDEFRLDVPLTFTRGVMSSLALRLYREFRAADEASGLAVEGLALELVAGAVRCRARSLVTVSPWLGRVREILHERFRDRLTILAVAQEVGLHPIYLGAAFRRHYGCSVGDYVRRLRVEYAAHRLSSSDEALSEIAMAAGFADQSHFSRTFRGMTGTTPSRYRALIRRG
jgi:AraC family transcriptional regulator